ncbi:hypothetical protein CMI47_04700 [Candidatus Pacearchaeota archaeon]|jgi:hypothetical protein|nr:hypothetical protein [Candidatus Pacearchaeota archaeon]|tara:strand:+ start:12505 stop:13290 length:786 start_codon:yes stop_codon:yes gene_type:complete
MKNLEHLIDKYYKRLRSSCHDNLCDAENGVCYCKCLAEVMGYQHSVIPGGLSSLEFSDFTGNSNNEKIISKDSASIALSKISEFCFGSPILLKSNDRKVLNKKSIMDRRFNDGNMVFIHGEKRGKNVKSGSSPLGRSMIASLILKEAIWRRLFSSNRAYRYHYAMLSKVKSDIFDKSDDANLYYNSDWLVLDDIFCEPDKMQGIAIDKIVAHRIHKNLPCIFCFEFDLFKKENLSTIVGRYIPKLLYGERTFLIDLSQHER